MKFLSHISPFRTGALMTIALPAMLVISASGARGQTVIASTSSETLATPKALAPRQFLVARWLPSPPSRPQPEALSAVPQQAPLPPEAPHPFLGRFEVSQWGSSVSNGFGNWYGGGVHLFLDP